MHPLALHLRTCPSVPISIKLQRTANLPKSLPKEKLPILQLERRKETMKKKRQHPMVTLGRASTIPAMSVESTAQLHGIIQSDGQSQTQTRHSMSAQLATLKVDSHRISSLAISSSLTVQVHIVRRKKETNGQIRKRFYSLKVWKCSEMIGIGFQSM